MNRSTISTRQSEGLDFSDVMSSVKQTTRVKEPGVFFANTAYVTIVACEKSKRFFHPHVSVNHCVYACVEKLVDNSLLWSGLLLY